MVIIWPSVLSYLCLIPQLNRGVMFLTTNMNCTSPFLKVLICSHTDHHEDETFTPSSGTEIKGFHASRVCQISLQGRGHPAGDGPSLHLTVPQSDAL